MIIPFLHWVAAQTELLEEMGIMIEHVCMEDVTHGYIDFRSEHCLGHIVIADDQLCAQTVHLRSGVIVCSVNTQMDVPPQNFFDVLAEFFYALQTGAATA